MKRMTKDLQEHNATKEDDSPELINAAKAAAGNWRKFESFGWSRISELDAPGSWTIVYTHHRDSRLLDQSNAAAFQQALRPYLDADDPDIIEEHHGHWAYGWVDGFAIRVFRDGKVTPVFRAYLEILARLENYPVLDEQDYSRREYEATMENFDSAVSGMRCEYQLPEDWKEEVFRWFWQHDQRAVENRDDSGGYPSEEQLESAFAALGYPCTCTEQ
ncbi:MAG: hypothetical protein ACYC0X_15560 [Pirellulaceae bacterium]